MRDVVAGDDTCARWQVPSRNVNLFFGEEPAPGGRGIICFFGQAVVGQDLPTSLALTLNPAGQCLAIASRLRSVSETRADDEGLNLLVRFDGVCGPGRLGRTSAGDPLRRCGGFVIGFACLEAEAGGELALGRPQSSPRVIILTFC